MDIQEAIEHAKDVANKNYLEGMLCHANPDDDHLDACIECAREHEQLAEWLEELQQYKQLGTLKEVREAVERKKPKTPTYDGDGYADGTFVWDEWICPRCGTRYDFEYDDYDYCPNCGQKIDLHADWSEEDD